MPSSNNLTAQSSASKNSLELFQSSLFGQLFETDKSRLYAYIFAYMQDKSSADDVFQETCLMLWKEFENFEPGTNFSKWANSIAFNRVHNFRRSHTKYELGLTDDFLQEFSKNITILESHSVPQELQWRYLELCRNLLSPPLQGIYQSFYVDNQTAPSIAESSGRSIHAIRKSVHKLRKYLFECVEQKIEKGLT